MNWKKLIKYVIIAILILGGLEILTSDWFGQMIIDLINNAIDAFFDKALSSVG